MKKKISDIPASMVKRIIQIILLFVLVIGILVITIGAMLGVSIIKVAEGSPKINPKNISLNLNQNSNILDRDGNLIESIAFDEYREIISIKDVPKSLKDAFISLEDERFETHNGVDPKSVLRSFITNVTSGGIAQGGSTITQQLIKNVYLTNEVSWERKIQEMYLALGVEKQISKDEILEGYLNRVFLGQNSYGVEAAAQTYFSKSAKDLNIAQSAAIASIVQAPSNYSLFYAYSPADVPKGAKTAGPYRLQGVEYVAVLNDAILDRKNYTLKKMYNLGKISKKEYDEALKFDLLGSVKPGSKENKQYATAISSLIKSQAIDAIMQTQNMKYEEAKNLLYTGGLDITTTIDWNAQKKLEETYSNFANIFSYQSNGGPLFGDFKIDNLGDIVNSNKNKIYYKKSNLLTDKEELYVPSGWYEFDKDGNLIFSSSRLAKINNGIYIKPFYKISDDNQLYTFRVSNIEIKNDYLKEINDEKFIIKKDFFENVKDFYKIENNNLIINKKYYAVEKNGTVQPQSSTVVLDSKTAEVVAMVAKRGNSDDDTIDRATNFFRQPASSMKPLAVYAPAIEEGRTLATPIDDTPYELINNLPWPVNYDNVYRGIVTTRDALKESLNPPAVKILGEDLGVSKSIPYLEKLGLINKEHPEEDTFVSAKENPNENDERPAMGIGSVVEGFSVFKMANAYQTFANNGERIPASVIIKIEKPKVGIIYKNEHKPIKVFSKETSFLITDVLKGIVNDFDYHNGALNPNGIETAGKTGTNNDNADFWFAGFNPYYTSATWIGFDNNNLHMFGKSANLTSFFGNFMNKLLEGKEPAKFEKPKDIVEVKVSKVDGLLPSKYTSQDPRGNMIYSEYFKKGTEPTKVSNSHVLVNIDKRNNLLAVDKTPLGLVEQRVFVNRPIPYNPSQFNNIVPRDWAYNVPTKFSDLPIIIQPEVTKLPDGSIMVTTRKENGDVKVVTTRPDGTVITQVTTKDGKVTTTIKKPTSPISPLNSNDPNNGETNKETQKENNSNGRRSIFSF
ncbi:transglycosylase domain-containing protein [Helcococcus bovis]|uniref:transglycosylase domain-containing protein n=1 Tax=Helcococcus bovis TaxID=3153252 RepID=UPI0038BD5094